MPTRATAPGSSSRCRTRSCAASPRRAAAARRVRRRRLLPAAGRAAPARVRAAAGGDGRGGRPDACLAGATYPLTVATSARTRACSRRVVRQFFVAASPELAGDPDAFERKLYVIRRVAELAAGPELVVPSFSARTLVYKGMLTAPQLGCISPISPTTRSRARWRSSTRASRRTRSRAGSSRTRTG